MKPSDQYKEDSVVSAPGAHTTGPPRHRRSSALAAASSHSTHQVETPTSPGESFRPQNLGHCPTGTAMLKPNPDPPAY